MYNVYICVHIHAHRYIYMLLFQKKTLMKISKSSKKNPFLPGVL